MEASDISMRKLFLLLPSCGCVSRDKFHVGEYYPFPKDRFMHTLNSTLPKTKLSKVFICSLS